MRRTPGRKKTNKKNNQPEKFPWKITVLAVFLLGAFIVGLYFLNQEDVPADVNDVHLTTKTQPDKAKLPPKPKENFEYEKILENKTVQVNKPPKPDTPKAQRSYQMQCGAYRIAKQAEERQATIIFNTGIEAQVKRTEKNGSVWHRVVLGPYKSKRKAEVDKHKLQALDIECGIWYWTY